MSREFALPGTRPRWAPDRVVDVEHIRLAIEVEPQARRIHGTCALTVKVIAAGTRTLELDAVELDITAVTSNGKPLEHKHDGRHLRVDLGAPRATGDHFTIEVAYAGSPRRGLYFIAPDPGYPDKPVQVWSQGQDEDSRYWFPCVDAPNEKATSEVIATVPAGFFALSNGELVSDEARGATRVQHWRHTVPHSCYLVTLAVGAFSILEERWRDVVVTYLVAPGHEAHARRTVGRTPQMLEHFSHRFGVDYPYTRYAQVFVADFIFGGMENTTATTLTDQVLLDERAAIDHDVESLIAHELAHQWFGDLVTCRDWGEGWLNEGFATYSEYIWREHVEGRDAADLELDEWAEAYLGEDSGRYRRTIATKLYDEPIDIFDHHLYEKGGRVLHMLRQVLGDDAYWAAIRHYLLKHRQGVVETRDLARAVEEATGRNVDWFFAQWVIDGAGHPELAVELTWDPDKRVARVGVTQEQKVEGKTPLFRVPAIVRFKIGGEDVDVPIELLDKQHAFFVPLAAEPTQMIFDPGRTILCEVKTDKSEALWIAELAGATRAIDRIHAAKALARRGGPRATEALITAMGADPFWAVRGAAAAGLGTIRTDATRDALIRAVAAEKHARARRGIAAALGDFKHDDAAAAALATIVEHGDPSYFVEATACLALGRTRSRRAAALLPEAAKRASFTDVIRQHAWRGLAEARVDAAIPMLVDGTRWGKASQGRRAAAAALAQLARGRRDQAARDVREGLEELLADRDFRVQAAAIEALGVVGDPASIAPLRAVVERELDGRLRRRAKEIARDLGEGAAASGEIKRLGDEVEELRRTIGRLRERVDQLDALANARAKKKDRDKDRDKDKKKDKKEKR